MNRDEKLIELSKRIRATLKELEEAVMAGASDEEKDALADRFNAVSNEIARLGGWLDA